MSNEQEELENRRQAIIFELQTMKAAAAEKRRKFDFNNFWAQLPNGGNRSTISQLKWQNEPMHNRNKKYLSEVSELSYNTTWQQYFDLIDATLEELNKTKKLDLLRLKELQKLGQEQFRGVDYADISKLMEEFNNLLEPLYIELRLKGFTHYDLWQ